MPTPASPFAPVYRLTVFESRSASVAAGRDPAVNPAILTPAANAPHSDAFQVATATGIAGHKPIMGIPKGRRSAFDAATKAVDAPELSVDLLDINAVSGSVGNAALWVSGFIGNAEGNVHLNGCLVVVTESLDGGTTWSAGGKPFFVGRIESLTLTRPRVYTMKVRDTSDTLSGLVFDTPLAPDPDRSIAMLSPYGLSKTWNGIKAAEQYYVIAAGRGTNPDGSAQPWVEVAVSTDPNIPAICNETTWVNDSFCQAWGQAGAGLFNTLMDSSWQPKEGVRAVFILSDGTERHMYVNIGRSKSVQFAYAGSPSGQWTMPVVSGLGCTEVPSDDPYHIDAASLNTALHGGVTRCYLILYALPGSPSPQNPLLIERHPVQMLRDILDGKYGRHKADGTPLYTIDYDPADFDLTKWSHIPMGYWKIEKAEKLSDFISKYICLPHGLAYVMEPHWDGVNAPRGRFRLIDTSTDTILQSLGSVVSLTDDDLVSEKPPRWQHNRKDAAGIVEVKFYRDDLGRVAVHTGSQNDMGKAPQKVITSIDNLSEIVTLDPQGDVGDKKITVDAVSIRSSTSFRGQGRTGVAMAEAKASGNRFAAFSRGPLYVEFTCLRSTEGDTWPGEWMFNETSYLPDAASNLRGGKRLMLCVKREEDGLFLKLTFLDCGVQGIAVAPTFGAQSIGAQYGLVRSFITLNPSADPVVLQYAETPVTQSVPPAVGDPAWVPARVALADTFELPYDSLSPHSVGTVEATDTYIIVHRPAQGRMWVRGRSTGTKSATQPSAWVVAAPTDTNAPAGPSGLAVSAITTKTAKLSWTNASSKDPVEVFLGLASGGVAGMTQVFSLPAGSTSVILSGLNAWAPGSFIAGVRHFREVSGLYSPLSTVTFSTVGASIPADAAIQALYNGSPYNGLAPQPGDQIGIRLYIVPGVAGHTVEIQECDPIYNIGAPDAPAGPDETTLRTVAVVPGAQVPIEGFYWANSPMPFDSRTRYYRVRHHGDSFDPGPWTTWLANVPVVLQPVPAVRLTGLPTASITPSASNVQASETLTLNGTRSPGSIGGINLSTRLDGPDVNGVYQTGAWGPWLPASFPQTVTVNRDPAAVIQYNIRTQDAETLQISAVASHRVLPSSQVPGATGLQKTVTLGPLDFFFKAGSASGWHIDHDAIAGRNEFGSGSQVFYAYAPLSLPVGAKITALHAEMFQKTDLDAATLAIELRRPGVPATTTNMACTTTGSDFTPGTAPTGTVIITYGTDYVVQSGDRFGLTLVLSSTMDGGAYPAGLVKIVVDYTVYTVG